MASQDDSITSETLRGLKDHLLRHDRSSYQGTPSVVRHLGARVFGSSGRYAEEDYSSLPLDNGQNQEISAHHGLTEGVSVKISADAVGNTSTLSSNLNVAPRSPRPQLHSSQLEIAANVQPGIMSRPSPSDHPDDSWGAETQPFSASAYEQYARPTQGAFPSSRGLQDLDEEGPDGNVESSDASGGDEADPMGLLPESPASGQDLTSDNKLEVEAGLTVEMLSSSPGPEKESIDEFQFPLPKTPAVGFQKQHGNGGTSSTAITPVLPVNPFARLGAPAGGMMSLSQVFRATQAVTPGNKKLASDPLTDRPSPDIYNARGPSTFAAKSSPLVATSTPYRGPSTEPRGVQKSKLALQLERETQDAELPTSSQKAASEAISEDELDHSQYQEISKKRKVSHEEDSAKEIFAKVKASTSISAGSPWRDLRSSRRSAEPSKADTSIPKARTSLPRQAKGSSDQPRTSARSRYDLNSKDVPSKESSPTLSSTSRSRKTSYRTAQEGQPSNDARSGIELRSKGHVSVTAGDFQPENNTGSQPPLAEVDEEESTNRGDLVMVEGTQTDNGTDETEVDEQRKLLAHQPIHHFFCIQSSTESITSVSRSQPRVILPKSSTNEGRESSQFQTGSNEVIVSSASLMQAQMISDEGQAALARQRTASVHVREERELGDGNEGEVQRVVEPKRTRNGLSTSNSSGEGHRASRGVKGKPRSDHNADGAAGLDATREDTIQVKTIIPETSPAMGKPGLSQAHLHSNEDEHGFSSESEAEEPGSEEELMRLGKPSHGDSSPSARAKSTNLRSKRRVPARDARSEVSADQAQPIGQSDGAGLAEDDESGSDDHAGEPRKQRKRPIEQSPLLDRSSKRRKAGTGDVKLEQNPVSPILGMDDGRGAPKKYPSSRKGQRQQVEASAKPVKKSFARPTKASNGAGRAKKPKSQRRTQKQPEHVEPPNEDSPHPPDQPLQDEVPELESVLERDSKSSTKPRPVDKISTIGTPSAIETDITNPNRVFALFKGGSLVYHPATCLSAPTKREFRVRFDDGTMDVVDSNHVRRLDLREGDVVKVDLPGLRKKNYVVVGFKDKERHCIDSTNANPGSEQMYPKTDIRGFWTVSLAVKQQDHTQSSSRPSTTNIIDVPLTNLYIVKSNWPHFHDRHYQHISDHHLPLSSRAPQQQQQQQHIPSRTSSRPSTPSVRNRRVIVRGSLERESSGMPSPTSTRVRSGLFTNMVFGVSYTGQEHEKRRISKYIQINGGILLEGGFNELFDLDIPAGLPQSQQKPLHHGDPSNDNKQSQSHLKIKPQYTRLGFACLIANQHSRREKFIQALSLGIPCLAGRWIEDCIHQRELIEWDSYLLPSGESSFLRGAIRSRSLPYYPPQTARFAEMITRGPNLLRGRSVIFVTGGNPNPNGNGSGKGSGGGGAVALERQKSFLFLTCALGAAFIVRVPSLETAMAVLEHTNRSEKDGRGWDFLYVDTHGGDGRRGRQLQKVGGNGNGTGSRSPPLPPPAATTTKKGRRGKNSPSRRTQSTSRARDVSRETVDGDVGAAIKDNKSAPVPLMSMTMTTRTIDDEFLVQSLILGKLLPE
ncbi:MAG: hypothetical protein M1823_000801 [Watsoniomyces obsoletus]|nr:MAG: hypothetical protein M1823_000801 [Watsoniomyces obsoletus]